LRRLLGGDDEQKSAEDEDEGEKTDVDVCALGDEEDNTEHIDDMLNVMETLHDDHDDAQNTSTTTTVTTATSGLDNESAAAVCSTLIESDVGQALDDALQNGIDGLLSTICDDQIACTSSTVTASSDGSTDCLLAASVLPAVTTEADQHYLLYSAHTDELIDTFLRSADAGDKEAEAAVSGELQTVELTTEDWPVDSLNDDVPMGGMLVEFDSSLLTIIELESDQTPVDTATCFTVAPGGGVNQVVNGETTAWNVFQGLEVSQFQVVGSEQPTETPVDCLPAAEQAVVDDSPQNLPEDGDNETGSSASAHSPGPGGDATDDAGCREDVSTAAVKIDSEQPSNAATDGSDDEYVFIVDCVDGSDPEVEYEIVDEADKVTDSEVTSPDRSEVGTSDASDDVTTNT